MKKVLFFPQNETHIENFIPIIKFLVTNKIKVSIIDTTLIYKQKLYFPEEFIPYIVKIKEEELSHPFYRYQGIERVRVIRRLRKELKLLTEEYSAFIFGNDGALQRIIIHEAKAQNKKSILLLDGIISDYTYELSDVFKFSKQKVSDFLMWGKERLKIVIFKVFRKSSFNIYLPSIAGASCVDTIFVIGEHSKRVVEKYKSPNTKVNGIGLPRMKKWFLGNDQFLRIQNTTENIKVCFITSAYKWHGLKQEADAQHLDIELICETINAIDKRRKINFLIKIHPRENPNDYETYKRFDFVSLKPTSMKNVFDDYQLIFSHISTSIIEGGAYGRNVYSLMINFPYWKYKRSFVFNDCIPKVYNRNELTNLLLSNKTDFSSDKNCISEFISECDGDDISQMVFTDISF